MLCLVLVRATRCFLHQVLCPVVHFRRSGSETVMWNPVPDLSGPVLALSTQSHPLFLPKVPAPAEAPAGRPGKGMPNTGAHGIVVPGLGQTGDRLGVEGREPAQASQDEWLGECLARSAGSVE